MAAEIAALLAAAAVSFASLAAGRERRRTLLPASGLGEPVEMLGPSSSSRSPMEVLRGFARRRPARRSDVLEAQLADAIAAIAAGSRAGMSLQQAVALAAEQVADPLGGSLRAFVDQTRLGVPLEDALDRWLSGVPINDVRLAAAVLRLHHRTGGALAPVLEGLASTLRDRRAAVREVRSLTAQARLSGAILGFLPIGFFAFLWLSSGRDMQIAIGSSLGRTAIAVGLVLEGAAFLWIRRLLAVEQ
jgi:tight adherence protein B